MRPAHSAREIGASAEGWTASHQYFNEARAFSAGNHPREKPETGGLPNFNEARAFSAGNRGLCWHPTHPRCHFNEARAFSAGNPRPVQISTQSVRAHFNEARAFSAGNRRGGHPSRREVAAFNEARAFSAGNLARRARRRADRHAFNEARAFSAGNQRPVQIQMHLLRPSMRPAHSAREIVIGSARFTARVSLQ